MDDIGDTRYAVVSCHVERLLDDRVWPLLAAWLRARPGGFPVVSLLRPADSSAGEDESRWLARAREAAALGPVGLHTHWTGPTHARPTSGREEPAARVLREGRALAALGLPLTAFCGGGWYTDQRVAAAVAELGLLDCTPRLRRPHYLQAGEHWAQLEEPATLTVDGRDLASVPTTHSIGELARAVLTPGALREPVVHAYFHDTDLLDARRRLVLRGALIVLRRRRRPALLTEVPVRAARIWGDVAR